MDMLFRSLTYSAIWVLQLFIAAPIFADINASYLQKNTLPNGGIYHSADSTSPDQSTVESLLALKMLSETIDVESHIQFVESQSILTTSTLISLIKIKQYSGIDFNDDKYELLSRQNDDGGFGSYPGYDSTALDTGQAIEAFGFINDYQHDVVGAAVSFLMGIQNVDGGWSLESNHSSIYVTSSVLAGLRYFSQNYNLNAILENARTWLLSKKKSGGLYSSLSDTVYALLAIIPITIDSTLYSDSLAKLMELQAEDFSWQQDTYLTALVLQVLALSKSITLPTDPSRSYVQGSVIDRSTGLPIKNVLVESGNIKALTDIKGEFKFSIDVSGSYPISFSANGYNLATMTLNLSQMRNINLGELSLNPNIESNIFSSLQGEVTDKITGLPIENTTIKLTGTEIFTTQALEDGSYVLTVGKEGDYQLQVDATGYHSTVLSISITSGTHYNFSPVLVPINEINTVDVSLSASVLDGSTGLPIPNVSIEVIQSSSTKVTITDSMGDFSIEQLARGEVTIQIAHLGYEPVLFNAFLSSGNNVFNNDLEIFPIDPSTLYTTISGRILDSELGIPLSGVDLQFSGADSKSSVTDMNGDHSAQINASGQYDIVISKAGYHSLSSSIQLELGKRLVLNISMVPEGSEIPIQFNLSGQAIDDVTGSPVENAILLITGETEQLEGKSDSQGNWLVENIPSGNLSLTISANGYETKTASIVVAPDSNVSIGQIPMSQSSTSTQLSGYVINPETGEPVVGAEVSLAGLQLSTTTNTIGFFVINDITSLNFDISVSAPGHVTNIRTLQLTEHQAVSIELDIATVPENEVGIGIRSSVSDKSSYGAYQKALINVDLYNHDDLEKELWFIVQIKQGETILQEVPIGHLALPNDIADTQISIAENTESLAVQFEWMTQNFEPGDYQLVLFALDLQTRQRLASSQANVSIESSSVINGFESSLSPQYSNFESIEDIELFMNITHTSNENNNLEVSYEFLDPNEVTLQSGVLNIILEAGSKASHYNLASFTQEFSESGQYKLRLYSSFNGGVLSSESTLNIAPKVRVDTELDITPTSIIPDGASKRIHVDLKLSGRNEG